MQEEREEQRTEKTKGRWHAMLVLEKEGRMVAVAVIVECCLRFKGHESTAGRQHLWCSF
jgi:hypothetical protein